MRTEARRNVATALVDQIDLVGVEETILQANVDVVAERSADTRDRLPGKARVRIVEEVASKDRFNRNARNTGTTADKALKAVVVTEIEQAVDHEAQRVRIAGEVKRTGSQGTRAIDRLRNARRRETARLDVGFTEADFDFRAETAEVITDGAFDVIASAMVERTGIVESANVEIQVFDEHCASTNTNIPGVVARQDGRRQGGGGQRHSDGKLPHSNSPFKLRYTSRQTSYSPLWFRASEQIVNLLPKSRTCHVKEPKISLRSEDPARRGEESV
ncbi:hypothetical protein FG91_01247 [Sphingopyxis sp. LC81]|nr:hypothetical protein FG91_01247 [Sphingopyxis sp. LC81]